jgi:hypothetical protein
MKQLTLVLRSKIPPRVVAAVTQGKIKIASGANRGASSTAEAVPVCLFWHFPVKPRLAKSRRLFSSKADIRSSVTIGRG